MKKNVPSLLVFMMLLPWSGCVKKSSPIDSAIKAIEEAGITLSEPKIDPSPVAHASKDLVKRFEGKGGVHRDLQSPNGVRITFIDFKEKRAADMYEKLKSPHAKPPSEQNRMMREILGSEETIRKGNMIVTLRYKEEAAEEKERIVEIITSD